MEPFQHPSGIAGSQAVQLFSYTPSSSSESSGCSISMPSLCIVNVSHFVECVLVSRYGLHLHFPSNVIRIFSHVRWPFGYLFVKCFICSCLLPIFTILSFLFLICRNSLSHIYFLYLVAYLFTVLKVFLDEQSLNFKIVQFTLSF